MAVIIDGKALAAEACAQVAEETARLSRRPCLAAVLVGDDPASAIYVRSKAKDCALCGIDSRRFDLPADCTEGELLALIDTLNSDTSVDGILVQLPLPAQIDERKILLSIAPEKDVDGFHPLNVGSMVLGEPYFLPCTPMGIIEMLRAYGINPDGKICTIVGRSSIVGKPMGILMLSADATVISCHSHTPELAEMTRQADILVTAAGHPGLITADMVKPGAVVIDVAVNRSVETGKLCGDVCFDEVFEKASYITPVPGGVGPMTRAMLMKNILLAAKRREAK